MGMTMEMRDLGGALWRQKLLVLLILVVTAAAVAVGLSLAPKTYTATGDLTAAPDPTAVGGVDDLDALRGTLAELANSPAVVAAVQGDIDVSRGSDELRRNISGEWLAPSAVIRVEVKDRDPEVAADIANAVLASLPQQDPSTGAFVFSTTDRAQPPATYSSPNLLLAIGVGAGLGVLLSLCGAILRDRRTNTVDDAAGVESAAAAPLLAHVSSPQDPTSLPAMEPGTAAADVFRTLRTAMDFEATKVPVRTVVVAGTTSGDVNVWLGANLAIALAESGREVLLVDGRMGERFGKPVEDEPDTAGLYDVLMGASLESALSPGPTEHLTVLPSGTWGVEPTEALIEAQFAAAMTRAHQHFEVVVVLAPPLDICDDARVMAEHGSLVLAVPEGGISAATLRTHADRVRAAGARLLGVVLVGRHAERVAA